MQNIAVHYTKDENSETQVTNVLVEPRLSFQLFETISPTFSALLLKSLTSQRLGNSLPLDSFNHSPPFVGEL